MDVEIRTVEPEEWRNWVLAVERAFGHYPRPEEFDHFRKVAEMDRTLACLDRGEIVGTTAAFSFSVSVPGGDVPMAGVTAVGVSPTHRRRGLLTAMMRRQLEHVRDRGEPLAGLWASEAAIYQR